jgi:hypothetical protein
MYGKEEDYIQVLVAKQEGQGEIGRPRYILEGTIKMDLREIG